MPVFVDEKRLRFHLTDGVTFSRVIAVHGEPGGTRGLLDLYWGAAIADKAVATLPAEVRESSSMDNYHEVVASVCPVTGRGDYRPTMLAVQCANGAVCLAPDYRGYRVTAGKPELPGLPSTYAEDSAECDTLELDLRDELTGLDITLRMTVMNRCHALTQTLLLHNGGKEPLTLDKTASMTLNFHGGWEVLHLHGAWAKERKVERVKPMHATFTLRSERGASGHEHNPFLALQTPDTTEFSGSCCGVSLVYSGSFLMETDMDSRDNTRLVAGIAPCGWQLAAGESFCTPEAVTVWSEAGLNGMSQTLHKLYRTRLCRGYWRDRVRPVLVNNWEATFFDFDEEKLLTIARAAAKLGIELFVLDDGWFGQRNSDTCSLGDWQVNHAKLPDGLNGLGDKLRAMGLMFGLWVEPEMISPNSELYRAHPDWCLHVPGRYRTEGRNQLVLDMTRRDVQDWLIDTMTTLLRESHVDYVKWDMNRNFSEVGSALLPPERQREVPHRYMLGLYRVLSAVTNALPTVLFESCSGGGGRFDPGMLAYMPQTWTSDDTDGVERLNIQYGTSMAYPASAMGAHVSAVPNLQAGRVTTMRFRGDVALGGNMGYELDLSRQTSEDLTEIARQVAQVKRLRTLTQQGRFTRLVSPFEHRMAAWQFATADQSELLLCVFQRYANANPEDVYIHVADVDEDAIYQDDEGTAYAGGVLKHQGYLVPFATPAFMEDHASIIKHLTKID